MGQSLDSSLELMCVALNSVVSSVVLFCHHTQCQDSETKQFCVEKCKLNQEEAPWTYMYTLPRCRRTKGMCPQWFANLPLRCWQWTGICLQKCQNLTFGLDI